MVYQTRGPLICIDSRPMAQQLINKVIAPDKAASEFRMVVPMAIFLPSGHTSRSGENLMRSLIYQVEANGSALYLNKVIAPDAAGGDEFRMPFPNNILAVGANKVNIGVYPMLRLLIFINWKLMDRYLPDQGQST